MGIELLKIINPTINYQVENIAQLPVLIDKKEIVDSIAKENIEISKSDWNFFEISWEFVCHPLLLYKKDGLVSESFSNWDTFTNKQFVKLHKNEEEINRIFINTYNLQSELTAKVEDKDITIRKADLRREIRSFISYAVGCMFGRYSLDVDGLAYAGGELDESKYSTFVPDKDNILPITDEEYFEDDVVGLFCAFFKENFWCRNLRSKP